MKKIISILFLCILFPLSMFAQKELAADNWYTFEAGERYKGYMHQKVEMDAEFYYITTTSKLKTKDGEVFMVDMNAVHAIDKYLTMQSFNADVIDAGFQYQVDGTVEQENDSLIWSIVATTDGEPNIEKTETTASSTVDFFSRYFLLTQLDYTETGRILSFNSMETDELNYKENHYIDYVGDEVLIIEGQPVNTKKLTCNGYGSRESTYWLTEDKQLVKVLLDGYKVITKCKKEDIDAKLFAQTLGVNAQTATTDPGVVINGVKWATRNVDAPGTFAATPESTGKFYQWNRKTAWDATGSATGWDSTIPKGSIWEKANDPSPVGWHVPTKEEMLKLLETKKVSDEWVVQNGITGRKFTDKATGASLFLPAVGCRDYRDGTRSDKTDISGYYWRNTQSVLFSPFTFLFIENNEDGNDFYLANGQSLRPVATTEQDNWQEITSFDEIIGRWENTTMVEIPATEAVPASSIDITLAIEYSKSSNDSTEVTLGIKIDCDDFLTDIVSALNSQTGQSISKETLWEHLSINDMITINSGTFDAVVKKPYYIALFRTNYVETNSAREAWMNADKSQIKVLVDETSSVITGNARDGEWILHRK
jgi:hypothetical protein